MSALGFCCLLDFWLALMVERLSLKGVDLMFKSHTRSKFFFVNFSIKLYGFPPSLGAINRCMPILPFINRKTRTSKISAAARHHPTLKGHDKVQCVLVFQRFRALNHSLKGILASLKTLVPETYIITSFIIPNATQI